MGDPQLCKADPQLYTGDPQLCMGDPQLYTDDPRLCTGDPKIFTSGSELHSYWWSQCQLVWMFETQLICRVGSKHLLEDDPKQTSRIWPWVLLTILVRDALQTKKRGSFGPKKEYDRDPP